MTIGNVPSEDSDQIVRMRKGTFHELLLNSMRGLCIIHGVAREVLDEPGLRSVKQITRDCVFFLFFF